MPEIRELFAWARVETVTTYYGVGKASNSDDVTELLISNRETSAMAEKQGSLEGVEGATFDEGDKDERQLLSTDFPNRG